MFARAITSPSALRSLEKTEETIALHRRTVALAPHYADGHFSLGRAGPRNEAAISTEPSSSDRGTYLCDQFAVSGLTVISIVGAILR
jgi:hypothetical protein